MSVERRKIRMNLIKKIIAELKEQGKKAEKEYLIALLMDSFGISKRDAREEVKAIFILEDLEW